MAKNKVNFAVVVIGGSAGSLEVIIKIIAALPADTKASFIIVLHRKSYSDTTLFELLNSKTLLPVKEVEDKEPFIAGCIYIAPSDYHLLLENEKNFSLDSTEKINHSRPSIDVTFESVAEIFGKKAMAVLLSGANADGAEGLQKIKACGGYSVVQDPATAEVDYMPQQAIKKGAIDAIVPAEDLGTFIIQQITM